jgi:hypothetical protein
VIDLDRYTELDPDNLPGPAPLRRRPGARVLLLIALALLAAAPAAPPRESVFARAVPEPSVCRADAYTRLRVLLDDGAHIDGPVAVFGDLPCVRWKVGVPQDIDVPQVIDVPPVVGGR